MSAKDWDEIVYVDDDGLGFTRRDYPAFDYPEGTRVALAGDESLAGVVVTAASTSGHPGDGGALEWVPVRFDWRTERQAIWQHVDGLVILTDDEETSE